MSPAAVREMLLGQRVRRAEGPAVLSALGNALVVTHISALTQWAVFAGVRFSVNVREIVSLG